MQKNKLKKGLYVVTDHQHLKFGELISKTELILQAGISALQYRNKNAPGEQKRSEATELKQLCLKYDTCFIINDDVELAKELEADGVHLGENDASCVTARGQLGNQKIIGVSCYNDLDRAERAVTSGADYIAFGAMYPSAIKANTKQASPELIGIAKQKYPIAVVAIGGITPDNCDPLIMAGADLLAVISSVYLADDPGAITDQFNRLMKTNELI